MAKLNVENAIKRGRKQVKYGYTLTVGAMQEIWDRNSGDAFDILCDGFYLGVTQGIKIAKAELKRGAAK